MDPITTAIVASLSAFAAESTKEALKALKDYITSKLGGRSPLAQSIENLEAKPSSNPRQLQLDEEIQQSPLREDHDFLHLIKALQTATPAAPISIQQQAGDGSVQIGTNSGKIDIRYGG
jgi:hypothetical protein